MISIGRPPTAAAPSSGWFKASFSSNAASCVEVRFDGALVQVRDSKYRRNPANDPAYEPVLTITLEQWERFRNEATGRSEPDANSALTVETTTADVAILRAVEIGRALTFTAAEWDAFLSGAQAHEFDHPSSR
jgi:hypothetical protein